MTRRMGKPMGKIIALVASLALVVGLMPLPAFGEPAATPGEGPSSEASQAIVVEAATLTSGNVAEASDERAADAGSGGASADLPMPRYRVAIMRDGAKHWLPWMRGQVDEGGSDDCFAGEPGCGIVDVEFESGTLGPEGWFTKQMRDGKLIGLTVFYDTADPGATGYYEALYRCHWMGDDPAWGKWEHDDDDSGAGNDRDWIDMIELTIVPC